VELVGRTGRAATEVPDHGVPGERVEDRVEAKAYSGGMRRRLDIAASLITTPRLLFLDRPASSPTDPLFAREGTGAPANCAISQKCW
jgi:ABC-2 type transport system ATP-binding protein